MIPVILWLVVVVGYLLCLRYDIALMHWRDNQFPDGPQGLLNQVSDGFRNFAQLLPITVTLIIVAAYDRRAKHVIISVLVAQALAAGVYNSGKLLIVRYRPNTDEMQQGERTDLTVSDTWGGWQPGNSENGTQSFPSGHSGAAFALAGVLVRFYPRIAALFWVLATGCALSRYIDGVHWLSDCIMGAAIGYLCAWLVMRVHARLQRAKADAASPQPAV